jgi:serine/threonine-protein kinase
MAAIKLLLQEYSSNEEIVGRFFQEARAASRIKHPGIVEILDCDMHPSGRAYIVMEFLEGESLRECLARVGRMDQMTALEIIVQIALPLEAAHVKGIVHRDLKPDNVFLASSATNPGPPMVKILDFGIAKLAGDGDGSHRTKTGNLLGTPLYMSPEQCRGAGKVDLRADIYSLGCISYELLTGRPPFVRDGAGDLLVAHIMEPPKDIAVQVPGLAPGIAKLVMAMLEKDPARRPASMAEIAHTIASLTGISAPTYPGHASGHPSMPGLAPPSAPGLRAGPPVDTTLGRTAGQVSAPVVVPRSRGRALVIGGATAAAVIVAGVALRGLGKHDAPPAPTVAATAPASPAAVPAPTSATAPSPVAQPAPSPKPDVRIEVASSPSGAELWVDGEARARGRTPVTVPLAADAAPGRAVVRSPGYADQSLVLDPRGATRLMVRLEKAEKADKPRTRRASSKSTAGAGSIYRPMGD